MTAVEANIVTITVGREVIDDDIDELVRLLDGAGLDAIIEPVPSRMGIPGVDLVALAIEIPLETLGSLVLTAAGWRIWNTVVAIVRRRRDRTDPAVETNQVVVAVHDTRARIRLDLTLDDLGDDRLRAELARLSEVTRTTAPVVLRWNAATAGWQAQTPDSPS